ncbi:hypothetical protein BU26DRAFT_599214 [Trematosphaeria pertusa]|uniref:Uncharacterized protein n=1 Tax=Trematosphaeria pertusa TaxID=390896 RepID=A0A6A6J4Y2_9PLEO|nr:uncharacterized protein BU26DRAFT_599214 [Trematosphaeria pertusa]KAF2256543.1 hypothetical protein BU26DRAFT_599214 [Trematosphaeria pertusa]
MDIIHAGGDVNTKLSYEEVDLDLLAKIAVVVDYYHFAAAEPVKTWGDQWMVSLDRSGKPVLKEYCPDLMLWMCVAYGFRDPFNVWKTSQTMLRSCKGWIDEPEKLPIAPRIKEMNDALTETINELHELLLQFQTNHQCPLRPNQAQRCGSELGWLTQEMDRFGILALAHTSDLIPAVSIEEICRELRYIGSPNYHTDHPPCKFSYIVRPITDKLAEKASDFSNLERN